MLGAAGAGGLTDAQLLESFVARRDEAAFEVLVWRHGPKVLGVCRRVLRHAQDAEDAFQATFLVLVRKASSVGSGRAVGSWLYRVAYRVALRARERARKRAAGATPVEDVAVAERAPDLVWGDLRPVLDEEVNRLPEKYRAPFVLCYLDGKTNEQAARELGCPHGTVLSRLAWARQRLRARLTRRGLGLACVPLAATVAPDADAAVSPALVDATMKTVPLAAAGRAVGGEVAALTHGVLQTMLWTKVKIGTLCVLAAGTLALGGALTGHSWGTREATGAPAGPPQVQADQPDKLQPPKPDKPPDKAEAPRPEEKTYTFEMRDQPWAKVLEWYAENSGLPFVGSFKPTGTFTFIPPRGKKYTLGEITDCINEALLGNGQTQRYLLVRRAASFTLLPADEKVDPVLVARVRLDELDKRGRTELVSVVLPLTSLKATELGPEVKKLLGSFGEVVVMEKANLLVLQDTTGNLRVIQQTVKEADAREAEKKKEANEKK
jgi:RNA polymerase sigma factor (sigma-70 family)